MQIKKEQLEPDMEQWTGSRLGEVYVRLYYHPAYLPVCRVYHDKCWAG